MMKNARRTAVLVLALALGGVAGERGAEACGLSGANCTGVKPVCSVTGTCVACSPDLVALAPCPNNEICQSDGSCSDTCTSSYVPDGGVTGACTTATAPACSGGACYTCTPSTPSDTPYCQLPTPDCNAGGTCGCTMGSNCGGGNNYCDTSNAPGQCTNVCRYGSTVCPHAFPVCNAPDGGTGTCVECAGDSDCTSLRCDVSTGTCLGVDGGSTDGGGENDGGSTTNPPDGGVFSDGGSGSERDATVGGGDSGEGDDGGATGSGDIYRYGKVEGGGCSLTAGGAGGSGNGTKPVVFGFAALAGLLFMRRSQRRSERRRDGRR